MTKKKLVWISSIVSLLVGATLLGTAASSTHRGPFAFFSKLHPDLPNSKIPAVGIADIESFFGAPKSVAEALNYTKILGFECSVRNRANAPEYFETRNILVTPAGKSLPAPSSPAKMNISENHYCEYEFGPLLGTGQRWVLSIDIDQSNLVHEAKSYMLCDICP